MTLVAAAAPATPRLPAIVATEVVVAAMVAVNVVEHLVGGAWWLGPAAAVVLLAFARWCGLTWSQLGLHRALSCNEGHPIPV